jgi:YD repeat-containing protein
MMASDSVPRVTYRFENCTPLPSSILTGFAEASEMLCTAMPSAVSEFSCGTSARAFGAIMTAGLVPDSTTARAHQGSRLRAIEIGGRTVLERHYLPDGSCARIAYADGLVSTCQWDDLRRLVAVRCNDGRTTAFVYDNRGMLQRVSYPGGATFSYAYDGAERVTQCTLPDQRRLGFRYTPDGSLEEVTYDNAVVTLHASEHGAVRALTVQDGATRITFNLDTQRIVTGRVSVEAHAAPADLSLLGRWSYTPEGAPQSVLLPSGDFFQLVPRAQHPPREGCDHTWSTHGQESFEYDSSGNLTSITHGDGSRTVYRNDLSARFVWAIGVHNVALYRYDARGRIAAIRCDDGRFALFRCDRAGRFTSVRTDAGAIRLSYHRSGEPAYLRTGDGTSAEFGTVSESDRWLTLGVRGNCGISVDAVTRVGLAIWRYWATPQLLRPTRSPSGHR